MKESLRFRTGFPTRPPPPAFRSGAEPCDTTTVLRDAMRALEDKQDSGRPGICGGGCDVAGEADKFPRIE